MAVTLAALVTALTVNFRHEFQKAFDEKTPSDWEKVAMRVMSTSSSNTYGWLGQFPKMREWVGDRVVGSIKQFAFSITNKKFEVTVGVARDNIEDDNVGIYSPMMAEMGRAARNHFNEVIFKLLKDAFSTACYDEQFLVDTDHPINAKADGTGADASWSNMQAGAETPWFLLDNSRAVGALILQIRRKTEFQVLTSTTNEKVFMNETYRYGASHRVNAGAGLWQLIFGSKAELNAANFDAAFSKMCAVTADGGAPLGVKPTILVVGNSNRVAAEKLLKRRMIDGGDDNVNFGRVELLVSEWLA